MPRFFWSVVWGVALGGVAIALGFGFWGALALSLLAGLAWDLAFVNRPDNPFSEIAVPSGVPEAQRQTPQAGSPAQALPQAPVQPLLGVFPRLALGMPERDAVAALPSQGPEPVRWLRNSGDPTYTVGVEGFRPGAWSANLEMEEGRLKEVLLMCGDVMPGAREGIEAELVARLGPHHPLRPLPPDASDQVQRFYNRQSG